MGDQNWDVTVMYLFGTTWYTTLAIMILVYRYIMYKYDMFILVYTGISRVVPIQLFSSMWAGPGW